ncbi:MAG: 3-dehydroquinate synthase [Ignavibacterium sp.]|nr:MAG: 3-dehydroquinate synthase [Ignavibacterium sp.]
MKKVIVKSQQGSYPVTIGDSYLDKLQQQLEKSNLLSSLFLIIDENVANHHLSAIQSAVSGYKGKISYSLLPAGERTKSYTHLQKIHERLLNYNFGRDTTLIAIGGGVTGDLAGYAAASYMRGLPLVHIPTTLLAMIDSAIGGKTGINFKGKKNIIGAFYQPRLVFVDTMFLSSLPKREFNSALGELIKYGLISNKDFYAFLEDYFEKIKSSDRRTINKAIIESIKIKDGVVEKDEFEQSGVRKILNLGHTFAHAIESNLGFRIKHGEAVTAGIVCALFLSNKLGLLSSGKLDQFLSLPKKIGVPRIIKSVDEANMIEAMYSDKKNRGDKILFVLLSDIGKIVVDAPAEKWDIVFAIKRMKDFISV